MVEVGLFRALAEATQWASLRHSLPSVECSLLRLLIAFVLDIHRFEDERDWEDAWRKGRFEEPRLLEYFGEHRARLNLFDESHPLLQEPTADGDDKPIANLLPAQPSGTNALHFHHQQEQLFAVSPAAALQLLATVAPLMTAGGAGLAPSINGAPPWYVLLQGKNLFETLMLNCLVLRSLLKNGDALGTPAWRSDETVRKEERTKSTLLEALTWRPRRVLLRPQVVPGGSGICSLTGKSTPVLIARMKFSAGWSTRFEWRDPNAAYRVTSDKVNVLRPRENRPLWRDAGALLFARERQHGDVLFERPAVVGQFERFVNDVFTAEEVPLQFVGYGMRTDMKKKVFEWHREELRLPVPLLWKSSLHSIIETSMRMAEDVAYSIGVAIKKTYPRDGAGNSKAFDSLVTRTQSSFWAQLRPYFVDQLLQKLADLPEDDVEGQREAMDKWRTHLSHVSRDVLADAISGLDTDGEAIHRQISALKYFKLRLWALMNPELVKKRTPAKGDKT